MGKTDRQKQIEEFFYLTDKEKEELKKYPQSKIINQIIEERKQQDERFGGLSHDKKHSTSDWNRYIMKHLGRWATEKGQDKRYAMVRVAALALAALEAYDANGMCWFEDTQFANNTLDNL
jgi:hypothetical protein